MSAYERAFVCMLSLYAERPHTRTHTRRYWANVLNLHTNARSPRQMATESDR